MATVMSDIDLRMALDAACDLIVALIEGGR